MCSAAAGAGLPPPLSTSPVFCLWSSPSPRVAGRRWLITYMMQMNPLIEPKPVAE